MSRVPRYDGLVAEGEPHILVVAHRTAATPLLLAEVRRTRDWLRAQFGTDFTWFRPPHGKHPINLQRQCVFAGTINPPVGGYLKDPTGNRRIWPVTCNGMIDRDG